MSLPEGGLPADEKAKLDHLLRVATEVELQNVESFSRTLDILQQRKDQWFAVYVVLKNVEGNDKTADYGMVYFRRWTAGEVLEIMSDPVYLKANKILIQAGQPSAPDLTLEDQKHLYELTNEYIARALHPKHGITAQRLNELGNFAWTKFVFAAVAARSGMDTGIVEDISNFFRTG